MRPKMRTTAILVFHKVGHVLLQKRDNIPHNPRAGEGGCVGWSLHGAGQGRTLPHMINELDSTGKNGQSERAGFSHTYRPSICHISDRTVIRSDQIFSNWEIRDDTQRPSGVVP